MTDGLAERIRLGRERKARRYARALWESWTPAERAGAGVTELERSDRAFWKQLADSLGMREPSEETVGLILAKLREGAQVERGRTWP